MADELMRQGSESVASEGGAALKKAAGGKAAKKEAKKVPGKKAPGKKAPGKKASGTKAAGKKVAEKLAEKTAAKGGKTKEPREELVSAFHHLQRATAVASLMEEGSGGDLQELLDLGTQLYQRAAEGGGRKAAEQAAGLLRAVEHLALAGLYSARESFHPQVEAPRGLERRKGLRKVEKRLDKIEGKPRGTGPDLLSVAYELLRQSEASEDDLHLAHEMSRAADGLCDALEAGL